jgi:PAS domain S-box-containing protein
MTLRPRAAGIAKLPLLLLMVPLLAMAGLGVFGHQQLSTVEQRSRFVAESRIAALVTIGQLARAFEELRVEVRNYVLAEDVQGRSESRARFDRQIGLVQSLLDTYERDLVFSDEGRMHLADFRALSRDWIRESLEVMSLTDAGARDEAVGRLNGPMGQIGSRLGGVRDNWIRNNEDLAASAGNDVVAAIAAFRFRMALALVAGAIFVAGFGYWTFVHVTAATTTEALLESTQEQQADLQRIHMQADTALDLTKSGYWHVPLDGSGWYTSSPRAVAIYGEPPSAGHRYELGHWRRNVVAGDAVLAEATFDNFDAAMAGTIPRYDSAHMYKRPVDGRVIWVHALGHIERNAAGTPTDMYGVVQDITDFKMAELAMKESERRVRETEQYYRGVLELAPDGLMVVDANGVIHLANAQCESLFGYTREELLGKTVEVLVPSEIRGRHPALREVFSHSPAARPMGIGRELQGQRKDGSLFPVEIGLSPLTARSGQDAQIAVSIRDVTDRKRQEREIVAARKKAEEATEMKSMFLANMSHEIRTPMNAIIGLSHLALATPLTPKQRDYIAKVHNAGTSLLGIINDVLDFSKIEAGRLDLEVTDFKLDDVLNSVTTLVGDKASEKGIEFLADVHPDVPPALRGDPLRLGQIVTNLVNNAVKFTERGEVRVTVDLLERTGEKCHVKFSIRDTGIGLSREQAARLFQPFTQADMSTTRQHGGTGLGLTICRRLIELMGGNIWLESEPGVGSTFTFTVWLEIGAARGTGKKVPEQIATLRALVVDDNPAAREILDDLLKGVVLDVDSASSGEEAIAAIRARAGDPAARYHVVFMDWRMPGMDGLQASRAIREDESLQARPAIIMVTAFGREDVREAAEQIGLDGFLIKPVTKSTMLDALVAVFMDPSDQAVAAAAAAGEGIQLNGLRILIAEDNEINQQIARELLEGVGAVVEIAPNGLAAVDRLRGDSDEHPFDVVLMDLQMPIMDGYQAAAEIRGMPRFAALPIVAMTAHATIEERQRCLEAGMEDHLSKPIEPALMFTTLSRFQRPGAADTTPAATGSPTANMPVVPGLDTATGLMRVAGNTKLYVRVLRQFAERQARVARQIEEALGAGDVASAQRLAHTLKGLAGSIGASRLQSPATNVETLLRERADRHRIDVAIAALREELEPFAAMLLQALDATVPPAPSVSTLLVTDRERSRAAALTLAKLLADSDAEAVDFLETNEADLRPLFDDATWAVMVQQTRRFAFSAAQAMLDGALKRPL